MSRVSSGACLCGDIRFEAEGDPRWVVYCHCQSCRRQTASPATVFANFRLDNVAFDGERATYGSSAGVKRSFCGKCGTPIAYETDRRPGEIDLYVGAFASPEEFPPASHVFYSEHVDWFDTRDKLPRKP